MGCEAAEGGDELVGHAFVATIEEVGVGSELGAEKDFAHEFRAGDTLGGAMSLETTDPGDGHAVRNRDGGAGVGRSEARIAAGLHDSMDIDGAEIASLTATEMGSYAREGLLHGEGFDAYAEDVDERQGRVVFHGRGYGGAAIERGDGICGDCGARALHRSSQTAAMEVAWEGVRAGRNSKRQRGM